MKISENYFACGTQRDSRKQSSPIDPPSDIIDLISVKSLPELPPINNSKRAITKRKQNKVVGASP
jgi:hypothetical protein